MQRVWSAEELGERWSLLPEDLALLTRRAEAGKLGLQCSSRSGASTAAFGTELIEQRVPYKLNGTGRLDLLPEGGGGGDLLSVAPG